MAPRALVVVLVSDFFYPRVGGVETHIWALAQALQEQSHRLCASNAASGMSTLTVRPIILTHAYGGGSRVGVRFMGSSARGAVKVYYIPAQPLADDVCVPSYFAHLRTLYHIFTRERVDIVHGHAATSTFMHDTLLAAQTLGYRTVFTDHSLFGFSDAATFNINKFALAALINTHACISVSSIGRANLLLRLRTSPASHGFLYPPACVHVLPNAVDATRFTPDAASAAARAIKSRVPHAVDAPHTPACVHVALVSRLVYRKGVDLVVEVIPRVMAALAARGGVCVHWSIIGDGPKRLEIEEMREKHALHDHVHVLGALPHTRIRDVLCNADIFLNASLTEAFCIALLEAAACGCYVVATRVGGAVEVLPPRTCTLAAPHVDELTDAMLAAIDMIVAGTRPITAVDTHTMIARTYNWRHVAARTVEEVYLNVHEMPPFPLADRLRRYTALGSVYGTIMMLIMTWIHFIALAIQWWDPACDIGISREHELMLRGSRSRSSSRRSNSKQSSTTADVR